MYNNTILYSTFIVRIVYTHMHIMWILLFSIFSFGYMGFQCWEIFTTGGDLRPGSRVSRTDIKRIRTPRTSIRTLHAWVFCPQFVYIFTIRLSRHYRHVVWLTRFAYSEIDYYFYQGSGCIPPTRLRRSIEFNFDPTTPSSEVRRPQSTTCHPCIGIEQRLQWVYNM